MALGTPTYQWLNKSQVDTDFTVDGGMVTFVDDHGNTNYGPPDGGDDGLRYTTGSLFDGANTVGVTSATFGFLFKCPVSATATGWIMSQWNNFLAPNGENNLGIRINTGGGVNGQLLISKGVDAGNYATERTDRTDLNDNTLHHGLITWEEGVGFQIFIDGSLESSTSLTAGSGDDSWGSFNGAIFCMNGRRDNQPEFGEVLSYRHKIWFNEIATTQDANDEAVVELLLNTPPTISIDSITQRSI